MAWYNNAAGARLWYEDEGSGDAVVLLHGWCKSSAVWRFQLEALSAGFRVIAPDLAGYGRSECSSSNYSLDDYASDIICLVQQLSLENALLAGWSQGGQIALQALGLLRKHLSGLVLVSTTPRFTASVDYPYGLSEAEAEGMATKVRRHLGRALTGFNAHMFAQNELENCSNRDQIQELLAAEPLPATDVAIQGLKVLYQADMRPKLPEIDLPTMIINGDCDRICLPEASMFMAENIATSRQVVFPGCGHAPFLTHPDEFNSCISDFHRGNLRFAR